nr:MAG TPA: Protein of unknown function (DUF3172) [Caudoviricetes sp.]
MIAILEHSFNFNGFNCYVVLRHMGEGCVYRCGYVQALNILLLLYQT